MADNRHQRYFAEPSHEPSHDPSREHMMGRSRLELSYAHSSPNKAMCGIYVHKPEVKYSRPMVWHKSFPPQTSPHDRPLICTQTIAKRRSGSQTCKIPLARHLTMSNIFNESSPSVFWKLEKGSNYISCGIHFSGVGGRLIEQATLDHLMQV